MQAGKGKKVKSRVQASRKPSRRKRSSPAERQVKTKMLASHAKTHPHQPMLYEAALTVLLGWAPRRAVAVLCSAMLYAVHEQLALPSRTVAGIQFRNVKFYLPRWHHLWLRL
eukprot:6187003-Pleurochrysis_carterae.AAC.4